jgi:peptide/nickel transport system substrate-binding protein
MKTKFSQGKVAISILVLLVLVGLACGPAAKPAAEPQPTPASAAPLPAVVPTPTAVPTARATPIPAPPVVERPKYGGIVRERSTDWPPSFDVNNETSYQHVIYNAKFYNNLLWNPGGDEIECDICSSWRSEDGGKTLVFNLLQGIRFHNGQELTSKDVEFSLNKMMGTVKEFGVSPRVGLMKEYVQAIETPDPYTVTLRLVRPAPALPSILATGFTGIMPQGTTRDLLKAKPNASGPFMFKEAVRGSFMLMEKNPNYFKKGLPYLDGIKVFQIKGDPETQAALAANEIDWTQLTGGIDDTWQPRFSQLEKDGKVVRLRFASGCRPQGLMMNMNKPPFDNPKVRQAVNLVLDRKSYVEVQHNGKAVPTVVFPVGGPSARTEAEFWDQLPGWATAANKQREIEQAKRLMAEAGYAGGVDVVLDVRNTTDYMRQGEWAAAQLAKIGIRTKQSVADSATLFPKWQALDYQAFAYWFCQTTGDPDEMWGGYFITGGSRNWLGYSNKEIDDLYVQQSSEQDPKKRQGLNRRMEEIVLQDMPFAPLPEQASEHLWWSFVKGYRFGITFYATASTRHENMWIAK